MKVALDSAVFIGQEPVALRHSAIHPGTLECLKLDIGSGEFLPYSEGIDYEADYAKGTVRRLPGSSIGDFTESPFFGWIPFDHGKVKICGNDPYTVYFRYECDEAPTPASLAKEISRKNGSFEALVPFLKSFQKETLTLVVFGDSISTGGEAFPLTQTYYNLFASAIEKKYGMKVDLVNRSVGGDDTPAAMGRYERDMGDQPADIVLIAFGMNDQNCYWDYIPVSPDMYEKNIRFFIKGVKEKGAIPVLISPCLPHANWIHTSGKASLYADKLRDIAAEQGLPLADVQLLWQDELTRKIPDSLLHNGINHPNNYGHLLYETVLETLI